MSPPSAISPVEACNRIRNRVAFDKRRGKTTSMIERDVMRRMCPCDVCNKWRADGRRRS